MDGWDGIQVEYRAPYGANKGPCGTFPFNDLLCNRPESKRKSFEKVAEKDNSDLLCNLTSSYKLGQYTKSAIGHLSHTFIYRPF